MTTIMQTNSKYNAYIPIPNRYSYQVVINLRQAGGYFSFILQCYISSTLDRVCSEKKTYSIFFQARGTTPELLGISMTTDGGCMSPYRDFDVRSERKMKPSVGRTASFMSTTTTGATRQPHFSGGGQGKLLCVRFPGVLSKNNPSLFIFSPHYRPAC